MRPAITVVVPLYNSAQTVGETLRSLASQSLTDWEAVIVNDGSTDHGPRIAEDAARSDRRFRVIHQPNLGLAGARNTGLAHARGEFVHLLDADDLMSPEAFSLMLPAARKSRHGCIASAYEMIDSTGRPIGWTVTPPAQGYGLDELLSHNRVGVHAQLTRRSLFDGELFDRSLPVVEDYDMWLRLALKGVRWEVIGAPLAKYRIGRQTLSRKTGLMWETVRAVIERAYDRARRDGWHEKGVDVSLCRQRRALERQAIEHATIMSVTDPPRAVRLLVSAGCGEIRPTDVAETLHGCLPFAMGCAPSHWSNRGRAPLLTAARTWIESLVLGAHLSDEGALAAVSGLTACLTNAGEIADRMLDSTRDGAVALIGAGRNARLLADALFAEGRPFVVFDDNPEAARRLAEQYHARVATLDECLRAEHPIVTPLADEPLLSRLPAHPGLRRWSVAFERSRVEIEDALLREVLSARPAA